MANFKYLEPTDGISIASAIIDGAHFQKCVACDADGNPLTQPLTNAQLRAAAVPVSGAFYQATQPVSGPMTAAEFVALAPFPVSGTFWQATQPVTGPFLTDTQLPGRRRARVRRVLSSDATGERYILAGHAAGVRHVLASHASP
jgi:hypothetical protein